MLYLRCDDCGTMKTDDPAMIAALAASIITCPNCNTRQWPHGVRLSYGKAKPPAAPPAGHAGRNPSLPWTDA